ETVHRSRQGVRRGRRHQMQCRSGAGELPPADHQPGRCGRHVAVELSRSAAMNVPVAENAGVRSMKALKLAAAVVVGTLAVLVAGVPEAQQAPSPSSQQQQPSASAEVAVCNMSAFQGVFVALMHKQDAQKWVVEGWYAVPDSGCTLLGSFLR